MQFQVEFNKKLWPGMGVGGKESNRGLWKCIFDMVHLKKLFPLETHKKDTIKPKYRLHT